MLSTYKENKYSIFGVVMILSFVCRDLNPGGIQERRRTWTGKM